MERISNNYRMQDEFIPDAQEAALLAQLPPSFPLHYNSLLDIVGKEFMTKFASRPLLGVLYALHHWRRTAPIAMTLVVLLYIIMKPYLYTLILGLFFLCFMLPMYFRGKPDLAQILLAWSMVVLALRNICLLQVIKSAMIERMNTLSYVQSRLKTFELLGIDPTDLSVY
jgi:hypothetical protein